MDWSQTFTIIGTLGALTFTLFIIQRREIDSLRREINRETDNIHNVLNEIRKDVRLILDKIIPPYNKSE